MPVVIGRTSDVPRATLAVGTGPLLDYYPYDQAVPVLCHWRFGDFKRTLLDLTIRDPDGAVVGVTLTSFDGPRTAEVPTSIVRAQCVEGVPVVDAFSSKLSMRDELCQLSLHVQLHRIYLLIQQTGDDVTCLSTDRLQFFVLGEQLVGLGFGPLKSEERQMLLQMLDSSRT